MALTKYKLGDLIEQSLVKNGKNTYALDDVKGLSIQKNFIETKADMENVSLLPYLIVQPAWFSYVPVTSRNGEKITIAYNSSDNTFIVSSSYIVFKIKELNKLLPEYLFMYFNRSEFDRYSRFNSWGSARETFDFETMCDIDIYLPDISIQQKYVNIYNSMVANQKAYEKGLDDLKLICDAYIESLRKEYKSEKIGNYIQPYNKKNIDGKIVLEQGINIKKEFITPQRINRNLLNRKIVLKGQFAYCTQLNNENVAIAYRTGEDCVVSSVYDVFEVTKKNKLISEYLMLWLIRKEFGRFVYWASEGSAYEFLNYDNIANYYIPIPPMHIQESIANIYKVYLKRKEINDKLKEKIKEVCPVLVKGALDEGSKDV